MFSRPSVAGKRGFTFIEMIIVVAIITILATIVFYCPVGQPAQCQFPNESWAGDFGVNSALYYCIKGPYRAHSGEDTTYPTHCVNCDQ